MNHHAHIVLTVNGEETEVAFAPYKTLLEVLREDLGLCGTKHGCELGECGACAVLLDGQPVLSCLVLGVDCDARTVTTVEGLVEDGRLHPLQDAFADLGAAQCGYCTPGFLVTAKALLDEDPHPTRDHIREALSGCLCRCTGYQQIFEAVEAAIGRSAEASRSFGRVADRQEREALAERARQEREASAERGAHKQREAFSRAGEHEEREAFSRAAEHEEREPSGERSPR